MSLQFEEAAAIETAALMLGSDRSRGYCLEMICADFLAGANLDHGDPEMLLLHRKIVCLDGRSPDSGDATAEMETKISPGAPGRARASHHVAAEVWNSNAG